MYGLISSRRCTNGVRQVCSAGDPRIDVRQVWGITQGSGRRRPELHGLTKVAGMTTVYGRCTVYHGWAAVGHGAVRGPRWLLWRRGPVPAWHAVMRLREQHVAGAGQPETSRWSIKDTRNIHPAVSGCLVLAQVGSRKRITNLHASPRALRHAVQRCRLLPEDGSCSPVMSGQSYI